MITGENLHSHHSNLVRDQHTAINWDNKMNEYIRNWQNASCLKVVQRIYSLSAGVCLRVCASVKRNRIEFWNYCQNGKETKQPNIKRPHDTHTRRMPQTLTNTPLRGFIVCHSTSDRYSVLFGKPRNVCVPPKNCLDVLDCLRKCCNLIWFSFSWKVDTNILFD